MTSYVIFIKTLTVERLDSALLTACYMFITIDVYSIMKLIGRICWTLAVCIFSGSTVREAPLVNIVTILWSHLGKWTAGSRGIYSGIDKVERISTIRLDIWGESQQGYVSGPNRVPNRSELSSKSLLTILAVETRIQMDASIIPIYRATGRNGEKASSNASNFLTAVGGSSCYQRNFNYRSKTISWCFLHVKALNPIIINSIIPAWYRTDSTFDQKS